MSANRNLARAALQTAAVLGLLAGIVATHPGALAQTAAQPSPPTPAGPTAGQTTDDLIAARQAGYKHMGDLFGAMKKAIDANADVAPFASQAREIADWGRKIPTLFPPGTEHGHDTHARPEIWSDRAGFEKNSADLVTQADKLAQVAQSGDKSAFADQWKATGAVCGACHRTYRYRYS